LLQTFNIFGISIYIQISCFYFWVQLERVSSLCLLWLATPIGCFQFTTRHLQEFSEHLQRNNRSILSVVVMQFFNISYRAWGSIFIFYVSTSGYSKDSASFSARILCCILRFLILSENKDIAILL
jgi:hypothetical protein